jgi:hypothetical protein
LTASPENGRVFGTALVLDTESSLHPNPSTATEKTQIVSIMDVLQQILLQSAIGGYSRTSKYLVVSLFLAIVITLLSLLTTLLVLGNEISIRFGY